MARATNQAVNARKPTPLPSRFAIQGCTSKLNGFVKINRGFLWVVSSAENLLSPLECTNKKEIRPWVITKIRLIIESVDCLSTENGRTLCRSGNVCWSFWCSFARFCFEGKYYTNIVWVQCLKNHTHSLDICWELYKQFCWGNNVFMFKVPYRA